jgi:hypothetical protein
MDQVSLAIYLRKLYNFLVNANRQRRLSYLYSCFEGIKLYYIIDYVNFMNYNLYVIDSRFNIISFPHLCAKLKVLSGF